MAEGADGKHNSSFPHVTLNERIVKSMLHRSVAAHPWHDLEIGTKINSLYTFLHANTHAYSS